MILRRVKTHLAAIALFVALLVPAVAHAEFGTTDVQLLVGWNFKDTLLGYNSNSGHMTTVTLEHFSTWAYGDNFMFADAYRMADDRTGVTSSIYGEWHPRLFLNKLFGTGSVPLVKNWGLAGEINQTVGFYAYLFGVGLDLDLPGFAVAGLNVYYRRDRVDAISANTNTWQVSPFWTVPFKVGPTTIIFTGFVDVTTNHDKKIDVMAQPQLLVDVGAFAGHPGKINVGTEIYIHSYQDSHFLPGGKDGRTTIVAPQAMVQWVMF
jgi:nucleoside-specific outer membrane channel protein Tsx